MSEDSNQTIYVALIGEGVDVWRPVQAEPLAGGLFRIVTENPACQDEHWEFPTGSVVSCAHKHLSGGEVLVAVTLENESRS